MDPRSTSIFMAWCSLMLETLQLSSQVSSYKTPLCAQHWSSMRSLLQDDAALFLGRIVSFPDEDTYKHKCKSFRNCTKELEPSNLTKIRTRKQCILSFDHITQQSEQGSPVPMSSDSFYVKLPYTMNLRLHKSTLLLKRFEGKPSWRTAFKTFAST